MEHFSGGGGGGGGQKKSIMYKSLQASLFVASQWPSSLGQTNYQVHPPVSYNHFIVSRQNADSRQKERKY